MILIALLIAFLQGTIVIDQESAIDSTGASDHALSLAFPGPCPGDVCVIEVVR